MQYIKNAETRDRTGDLQIFGLTLSQLSYRGHVFSSDIPIYKRTAPRIAQSSLFRIQSFLLFLCLCLPKGPVAQWIRHRPTEPRIAGSSPAGVIFPISACSFSHEVENPFFHLKTQGLPLTFVTYVFRMCKEFANCVIMLFRLFCNIQGSLCPFCTLAFNDCQIWSEA